MQVLDFFYAFFILTSVKSGEILMRIWFRGHFSIGRRRYQTAFKRCTLKKKKRKVYFYFFFFFSYNTAQNLRPTHSALTSI